MADDEKMASVVSAGKRKRAAAADLAPLLEQRLPEAVAMAHSGNIPGAIESLLAVEKQCRQAEEPAATSKVANAIITICWETRDLKCVRFF